MSGRPGGRGKRTRYDGSKSFERRQTSNRYNDPPPRFANRQRNGDGRGGGYDGYYDEQPPGRSGSSSSGGGYPPGKRERERERDGWGGGGGAHGHGGGGGGRQQDTGGKSSYGRWYVHLVRLHGKGNGPFAWVSGRVQKVAKTTRSQTSRSSSRKLEGTYMYNLWYM